MRVTLSQDEIEKAIISYLVEQGVKGIENNTPVTIEQEGINGSLVGVKAVVEVDSKFKSNR